MKMILLLLGLGASAMAASTVPSTLAIRCTGAAPNSCASLGHLAHADIETLSTGNGKSDQFLVFVGTENNARCVVSKASSAQQGVTIEFLNEMANRYQVDVTCLYVFPLQDGQVSANNFSFRASIR